MRIRKLLKRFVATPMRRSDFLLGIMISRLVFMMPEVVVLLVFALARLRRAVAGSLVAVLLLILARRVHLRRARAAGGVPGEDDSRRCRG